MAKLTLEQLVDSGINHARHILLDQREPAMQTLYTLITDQNELILLPCTFKNDFEKDVTVAAVKATAALSNAVMALYVAEAWMLKLPPPLTPWHAKRQMENLPRPSQSPDRIEVVHALATDGTTTLSRTLQMVRNKPGGKLMSLVPMPELEDGEGKSYIGRMISGIIPPRTKEAMQ
jgi:hypothetical protein